MAREQSCAYPRQMGWKKITLRRGGQRNLRGAYGGPKAYDETARFFATSEGEGAKKFAQRENRLTRLAGRADKIAQHVDIGTIGADTAGIDGKAEALGEIEIDAGVIKFGKTETLGGQHAVQARGIHRPRRAMTLPRAARQFIKLLPIAFVPSGHGSLGSVLFLRLDARRSKKVRLVFARHLSTHPRPLMAKNLPLGRWAARRSTYFRFCRERHFPWLLLQTRYRAICFAHVLLKARKPS